MGLKNHKFHIIWEHLTKKVQKLNLKSKYEYRDFLDKNPQLNYPKAPDANGSQYRSVWKSWPEFLGSSLRNKRKGKRFRDFKEAREYAKSLNLKSSNEWADYTKRKNFPVDIPTAPYNSYKEKWISWSDWLGNTTIRERKYLNYQEAKDYIQSLDLKYKKDYLKLHKAGKLPGMPSTPERFYGKGGKRGLGI